MKSKKKNVVYTEPKAGEGLKCRMEEREKIKRKVS